MKENIVETLVSIQTGLINTTQVNKLVNVGIASWSDFQQRKCYDEFRFIGTGRDIYCTTFESLQSISNAFNISIEHDCILIELQ